MPQKNSYIEFISDQIRDAGNTSCRAMFGGHAVYCDAKVVALICNNQFYIKPTENGRKFIGIVFESPPYKGAKPYFLIEEKIENREWISRLIRITADELPNPTPKKKKTKQSKT
jgi:TfoX/Sxy family transcriptional regulator of competence genes